MAKGRQVNGNAVARLRIDDIVRDEKRFQFRPLDEGTVKRYASAIRSGVPLPPVQVADYNGALILVDGWHRLAARKRVGEWEVDAIIVPATSIAEVHWLAAEANTKHGRPLKRKELRKVFKAFVGAKKHRTADHGFKSYREIAAEMGGAVAYTTVRNWMKKDFPGVFRAMAMGGLDAPPEIMEETPAPSREVTLAETAIAALKQARAALPGVVGPGVTDRFEQSTIVGLLQDMQGMVSRMLQKAQDKGWEKPDF